MKKNFGFFAVYRRPVYNRRNNVAWALAGAMLVMLTLGACGDKRQPADKPASSTPPPAEAPLPGTMPATPASTESQPETPLETAKAPAMPATAPESGETKAVESAAGEPEAATPAAPAQAGTSLPLDKEHALALAQKSGCLACHKIESKVIGPPWQEVAKRYKTDPNARAVLIEKVKKGGKGNWTEITKGAAMPPYSPRVKEEDIAQLVDFVLSL